MGYWDKAMQNKQIAAAHTEEMKNKYGEEINACVSKTRTYSNFAYSPAVNMQVKEIVVEATDSVSALFTMTEGKTAVLNFASYTEPGGKFLDGSSAQEECLCHASFLFNVLREQPEYYKANCKVKNKALYTNRALYSLNVRFFDKNGGTAICDVITCASPNLTAAKKYCNVSDDENTTVLTSRIRFVLDIAANEDVDNLVLGAYGCGVFGQDPEEVSKIFKEELNSGRYGFKKVVFAIPGGINLEKFQETFKEVSTC